MNVLVAVYSDAGNYSLHLAECRFRKGSVECADVKDVVGMNDIGRELRAFPVLVLVGGYGVITRQADISGEIVSKVTAEGSGLLWTVSGNDISFVKEEQLRSLKMSLTEIKANVIDTQCVPGGNEQREDIKCMAAEYSGRYYFERVNIKSLLTPSPAGSVIARLTASKLKLPVLVLILASLVVNAMVGPDVRARHEIVGMELQALRKTIGQADDATNRQQELLSEYARRLPRRISFICDRAAMLLPEGITLTSLSVQRPLQSIDDDKKAMFAYDIVEIAGKSADSYGISDYITKLDESGIALHVRLTSMERERESGLFSFRITLEL